MQEAEMYVLEIQRLIRHFLNAFDLDVEDIKVTKISVFLAVGFLKKLFCHFPTAINTKANKAGEESCI